MIRWRQRITSGVLSYAPALLYVAVVVVFTSLSSKFLNLENFVNILIQSSAIAVMAVGMTFVLLTAGIDLSVGSVAYLASALAGTLVVGAGWPIPVVLVVMVLVGLGCGLANGLLVTRLRMAPFILTLAMLFVARGAGLWITETRAINLPDTFRQLATEPILGVPATVWLLALVLALAQWVLRRTAFGRQLYAVGHDPEKARRAGVRVDTILLRVYVICGAGAALGGMIALAQLASVSPNLGQGHELAVIAAAVLGGTSLFGGRGSALGSVLGAILVETVRNGLNVVDADPYIYPVITGAIIFAAVLIESVRQGRLDILRRRNIRGEDTPSHV